MPNAARDCFENGVRTSGNRKISVSGAENGLKGTPSRDGGESSRKSVRKGGVGMAKCTVCNFRRRDRIVLENVTGSISREGEDRQEFDYVVGALSLEKSLFPPQYYAVVTVSGADPNGELTAAFTIKIPTITCLNCGKVLQK